MPKQASLHKQLQNVQTHAHHLRIIREGTKAARKHVLQSASPDLVRALATVTRVVHDHGHAFPPHHRRRAMRLMSPSVSMANKKIMVSGKPGSHSHGAGFFQDIGHAFQSIAPALTKVGHSIEGGFKKFGKQLNKTMPHFIQEAAHEVEDKVHDFERVIQQKGGLKKVINDIGKDAEKELIVIGKLAQKHGPQALKMAAPIVVGMAVTAAGGGPMAGAAASAATKQLMLHA